MKVFLENGLPGPGVRVGSGGLWIDAFASPVGGESSSLLSGCLMVVLSHGEIKTELIYVSAQVGMGVNIFGQIWVSLKL